MTETTVTTVPETEEIELGEPTTKKRNIKTILIASAAVVSIVVVGIFAYEMHSNIDKEIDSPELEL